MINRIDKTLAALALGAMLSATAIGQDEPTAEPARPAKPSPAELREKQLDVSLEARDIERVLGKLKRASELSKTRIGEAAKAAESASAALDKSDSANAREEARQAAEMFREIARLLEALLAEETPQRIAAARNLASQLAMAERQFAQQFAGVLNPAQSGGTGKIDPNSQVKPPKAEGQNGEGEGEEGERKPKRGQGGKQGPPRDKSAAEDKEGEPQGGAGKDDPEKGKKEDGSGGGQKKEEKETQEGAGGGAGKEKKEDEKKRGGGGAMTEEERREALAERAEQMARRGETLGDILKSISESTEPGDKEAAAKVQAVLKETDLLKAIEAMQEAAGLIRAGKLDDARLGSLDIGDRMEITAQRLDAAYRGIVAPQAEELRRLEQQLAVLREELEDLKTPSQIAAWHRKAQELLDQLEKLGINEKLKEEFLEEMKKAGLGVDGARSAFKWGLVNDRYVAPAGYGVHLIRVQEEVQVRIQTLLLGDITSAADEATPPKYQELVERYYRVLAGDSEEKKK